MMREKLLTFPLASGLNTLMFYQLGDFIIPAIPEKNFTNKIRNRLLDREMRLVLESKD